MPTILNIEKNVMFIKDAEENLASISCIVDISCNIPFDKGNYGARISFFHAPHRHLVLVDFVGTAKTFHLDHIDKERFPSEGIEVEFEQTSGGLGLTTRGLRQLILDFYPRH